MGEGKNKGIKMIDDTIKLLSNRYSREDYFNAVVELIRKLSGCRCVGIRILDKDGNMPYESYIGFSKRFLLSDNWISIKNDNCICIRIILGELLPFERQFMTSNGSFYCRDITKFAKLVSKQKESRFRSAFVQCGFRTVSIIPISYKEKIIGIIHLADEKKNKVSLDTINFIELLAYFIGGDINTFDLDDRVRRSEELIETVCSKQKQMEDDLIKSHKELSVAKRLSDIGSLAATVAHELRNPLSAIQIATFNIKKKAQNPLLESHLINIKKKIYESNQIINNLLSYSRIKMPNYESINIYDLLQECTDTVKKRFYRKKVSICKKYKTLKNVFIDVDSIQIKELFNNILNNACDAVSESDGIVEIDGVYDKKSIKVCISDNGVGICKEDLNRVFEPFFTTKARGTGLGLSVCYQIVKLHNGNIDIESEIGKGTYTTVILPLVLDFLQGVEKSQ